MAVLSELVEKYKDNGDKFAFFVGAGLSMPLFPSWQTLLGELLQLLEARGALPYNSDELQGYLEKGENFLDIADLACDILPPSSYQDFLNSKLDKDISEEDIPEAYRQLTKLNPKTIITTNYDRIPDVLVGGAYRIFTNQNTRDASKRIQDDKKVVIKLHGKIEDHDSMVLTLKEYKEIMNKADIRNLMSTVFTARTVIFIGFSLSDPHIMLILETINSIYKGGGPSHYALIPSITEFRARALETAYSVKIIPYKPSTPAHPEVVDFISCLAKGDPQGFPEAFTSFKELKRYGEFDPRGIVNIVDVNTDRIREYKTCLLEARGDCFISGTSMVNLTADSDHIIQEKAQKGVVRLLLLDPGWIGDNTELLTFLDIDDRKKFPDEINTSLRKLKAIRRKLPKKKKKNLKIKIYKTVFPYIITGYQDADHGKMVVEITDYIPEPNRPRFTLRTVDIEDALFDQIKRKFDSLWNNKTLSSEVID